jgi:hypothetical protein
VNIIINDRDNLAPLTFMIVCRLLKRNFIACWLENVEVCGLCAFYNIQEMQLGSCTFIFFCHLFFVYWIINIQQPQGFCDLLFFYYLFFGIVGLLILHTQ